jgi:hypothetical protein
MKLCGVRGAPNGIRTRATAVKGRGPRPLDDGDKPTTTDLDEAVEAFHSIGVQ